MTVLFERRGFWRCELTEQGIFFVHMLVSTYTVEELEAYMDEQRPHLERLQPVLFLNNATDIQEGPLNLQWRLAQHMKRNAEYIRKSALFGLTPRKAFMVRAVVRAAGRDNVRIFDTRAQCEEWLLAG